MSVLTWEKSREEIGITHIRLAHSVRLLVQHTLRQFHPQMGVEPRPTLWQHLHPAEIIHGETRSIIHLGRFSLAIDC